MRALHFQRVVGSGAFGAVYLCDLVADKGFRRQVAVKVLQRDHPNSQMFMSRVRDEARLLGLLQDDHILKVLEIVSVDGRDAVVMEFVEGLDLSALIEARHKPPARALAELGGAIAGALHRAHTAVHPATGVPLNVIHRDVKPANVMITLRGGVKLLDFGVARARFEARESFTGQFVLGTLNYMAPEYIVTGDVSPAADVYGLGLVIWEAAIGEVFGQPRLKLDQHNPRREAQLARVTGEYEPLVPLLRRMLEWEPLNRPDTSSVEQELVGLADGMRGSGLRAWCGTVLPTMLAQRKPGADENGLVGRQVQLAETPGDEPPDRLAKGPDTSSSTIARPAHAPFRPVPAPALTPSAAPDPPNTLAALGRSSHGAGFRAPAAPELLLANLRAQRDDSASSGSEGVRGRPPPLAGSAGAMRTPDPTEQDGREATVGYEKPRPVLAPSRTAVPEAEISQATPSPKPAPPTRPSPAAALPGTLPPASPQESPAPSPSASPSPSAPSPSASQSPSAPSPSAPLPGAALSAPAAPANAPAAPAPDASRRPSKARGPSTAMLIVQGLVVGGGLGLLVVLFLLIAFLLRRYL